MNLKNVMKFGGLLVILLAVYFYGWHRGDTGKQPDTGEKPDTGETPTYGLAGQAARAGFLRAQQ